MKHWISAGSFLGLHRDDDLIKGDTDIDFAMEYSEGIEEQLLKTLSGYELVRTCHWAGQPTQLAFMKDGILVDIYIHYPEGENLVNWSESGKQVMKANVCRDLREVETKYGKLSMPPEEYLEIRYGSDWRIPKEAKPINYEKEI